MNNPYFYNQSFSPYNQPNNNNLIRVNGLEGAKAYQIYPNSTVALFDSNDDLMYIKSCDMAGFPVIRTFEFREITQKTTQIEPQISNENFISREEFEKFKEEMMAYGKQSVQQSTNNQSQRKQYQPSAD